ncbi:hypothetical protein D9Q98_007314 [Chlorella vulgaris]|uniref:DAGKc domain-containing protein n=1 Tax=Chlorella vulgaris TaxID=3077 RepID=A0A9D4YVN1_CHLVU|nr:hypothetical protein D9Q98_007314 [Chlorella vulgaris]
MANEVALLSPGSHSASDVEAAAGDAQAFRAQLRGRGDLLELRVAGDGTCDIRPVADGSPSSCPAFLAGLLRLGSGPPPQISATDIIGATASGCELVIWHAPLQGKAAAQQEKPSRRLCRTPPLVLESPQLAEQAVKLLRSTCCCWGSAQRPPRLLIIVNPASGPGKAPAIYEREVRPALEAAGCHLDMHVTKAAGHATELMLQVAAGSVDAVVALGGDGTMHEALQGLLTRQDWEATRQLPLAQIPCGSGNALAASVGMWNVHTALHAIIKGQQRPLDIASVVQHERRCFSFLSVSYGLITNLDIGTEHLRWMGGNRFVVGALQQIMLKRRHTARVALLDLDPAVIGEAGLLAAAAADAVGSSSSNPNSTPRTSGAGSAASAEGLRAAASLQGPPVQHLAAFQALSQGRLPSGGWQWLPDADVALFTATNLPRLDMNFHLAPMAAPDSGCFDLIYTTPTSRMEGLKFMTDSEKGQHMSHPRVRHRRVAAMALEPQSTGTWLVVDGEVVPFKQLFMEVHPSLCNAVVAPTVR